MYYFFLFFQFYKDTKKLSYARYLYEKISTNLFSYLLLSNFHPPCHSATLNNSPNIINKKRRGYHAIPPPKFYPVLAIKDSP